MSDFLNDVKKLSPQDIAGFKMQVEQDPEAAKVLDTQLSKMTAQERAELEGILTGSPADNSNVPEQQEVASARQEVANSPSEESYTSVVTENLHGMAQAAVSQLPFGERVLAAGEAAYDVMTDRAPNLSEAYYQNVTENIEETNRFSEESPVLDFGARAVSEMAQLWTGGTLIKGGLKAAGLAGKAKKAGEALSSIPMLGKMAPKYGGAVVLEGALQTARDLDMEGRITLEQGLTTAGGNLALAATFGKMGDVAETALKGVAGRIASTPAGEVLAKMKNNLVKNISTYTLDSSINKINKFVTDSQNTLNPHVKIGSSEEYFELVEAAYRESGTFENVVEAWGAKNIDKAVAEGKKVFEKTAQSRDIALNNLRKLGKTPEAVLGDGDVLDIIGTFQDSIKYDTLSDQAKGMANTVINKISRLSRKTGADLFDFVSAANSAKMPNSIRKDLDELIKLDPSFKGDTELFLMQARKMAYDKMEDAASMAAKAGDASALASFDAFVKYNKLNRVMHHNLNSVLTKANLNTLRDEMGRGAVETAVHKTIRDIRKEAGMVAMAGATTAAVSDITGLPATPILTVATGAYAIPKLVKHFSKAPTNIARVGRKVLKGLEAEGDNTARELSKFYSISEYLEKTSGIPLVQNAALSFVQDTESGDEYERFNRLYSVAKASSHLASSPLKRTTTSVMQNREALNDILRAESPEIAAQLNDAIERGEDISPIMDTILKNPMVQGLVADGVGFDGKVYAPEDKAALEKELLDNVFVPGDYKIQMTKALRDSGIIPQIEEVPKRVPKRFEKRDKRRPY